ncbi:heparan N-sulfatase [Candidatus Poribacteria bacterium]|nr:MAG: heparan N-sulfatase [Candidatus Poribacteria bacterium]
MALTGPRSGRRNVVLIVVDDQGYQAGCYGDPVVQTPNLDALAAEGTIFTHAFCTSASCSASRSVILTGLYNHANGQFGHAHEPHNFHTFRWVRSLPVLLAEAGYRTCLIGKFHVQPEEVYHFEQYLNKGIPGGSRNPVAMAEKAREFIQQDDPRPFFLYFCPSDPHRAAKGFANDRDYPGVRRITYDPQEIPVPPWLPDYPETRAELAEYYTAISRLDQGIGRLMEVLKETGHWEDTLIIYLSDNGPPWPGAKTTLYEPGVRLPLIIRSPDQRKRGIRCNAMVTWADITPTILEFTGAKPPDYPLHGRSLLPILEETDPEGWDEVFLSHTFHEVTMYYPMRAIRTRKYKLILNLAHWLPYPFASDLYACETWQATLRRGDGMFGRRPVQAYIHRPQWELYDLENDPDEVVNLADDPKYADILEELRGKLRRWQEETNDPWTVKYRYE